MNFKIIVLLSFALLTAHGINALATKIVGNGGDICEDRIKIVRDDITSWIRLGGAAGLALPVTTDLSNYVSGMQNAMAHANVSCTDDKIEVSGAEKSCANGVDQTGVQFLICNRAAFANITESDQYVLIHHEFAGLAGVEKNDLDGSQYPISNQISEFLQNKVVKQLGIKKYSPTPRQQACDKALANRKNSLDQTEANYQAGLAVFSDFQGASLDYQQLQLDCQTLTLDQFCLSATALAQDYVGALQSQYELGMIDQLALSQAQDKSDKISIECSR